VVKLLENGTNTTPFLAKMLPPMENRTGQKEKLIAQSRERFTMLRVVIEDKLNRWMRRIDRVREPYFFFPVIIFAHRTFAGASLKGPCSDNELISS